MKLLEVLVAAASPYGRRCMGVLAGGEARGLGAAAGVQGQGTQSKGPLQEIHGESPGTAAEESSEERRDEEVARGLKGTHDYRRRFRRITPRN